VCRNTNIINTCVVFPQWHIHSNVQFFLSCVAVVLIGVGYEWLRDVQKRVDRKIAAQMLLKGKSVVSRRQESELESETAESEPLLIGAGSSKAGRR
jgi:copper transporter 1